MDKQFNKSGVFSLSVSSSPLKKSSVSPGCLTPTTLGFDSIRSRYLQSLNANSESSPQMSSPSKFGSTSTPNTPYYDNKLSSPIKSIKNDNEDVTTEIKKKPIRKSSSYDRESFGLSLKKSVAEKRKSSSPEKKDLKTLVSYGKGTSLEYDNNNNNNNNNNIEKSSSRSSELRSLGNSKRSLSPEKRVASSEKRMKISVSQPKQMKNLNYNSESALNSPTKKNGNVHFLTDLEIASSIQSIMNNGIILKNLLLNVANSMKNSKNDLQELTSKSKTTNHDIISLINSFSQSQENVKVASDEFKKFCKTVMDKLENNTNMTTNDANINILLQKIDEIAPSLQNIVNSTHGSNNISDSKQTDMTYNIIKANRGESLNIIKQINMWKESQEMMLRKIENKIINNSIEKKETTNDNFLLLSNMNQIIDGQLNEMQEKNKKLISGLEYKLDNFLGSEEKNKFNDFSHQLKEELQNVIDRVEFGISNNKTFFENFGNEVKNTNENQLSYLDKMFSSSAELNKNNMELLLRDFQDGFKETLMEKLISENEESLLHKKLITWSSNVDKNISQLLISSLNSKFQKSLTGSVASELENNFKHLKDQLIKEREETKEFVHEEISKLGQTLPVNSNDIFSSNDRTLEKELEILRLENENLKAKIKRLERALGDYHHGDKIQERLLGLQTKKVKVQTQLSHLNELYFTRYNEFQDLESKYKKLQNNINELMFEKYEAVFSASTTALINKNNAIAASNIGSVNASPFSSPIKSKSGSPEKKILSPIRNVISTTSMNPLKKSTNLSKKDFLQDYEIENKENSTHIY